MANSVQTSVGNGSTSRTSRRESPESPSKKKKKPSPIFSAFQKHAYTIFLFTASDFKTIVVPKTIFGTCNALCGRLLSTGTVSPVATILARVPLVFLWVWINLLPFNINNQRQPEAVLEDRANKAWRPMPSQRISPAAAFRLMMTTYFTAFCVSWYLEATIPCVVLMALGFTYNDLGGADASCLVRNLLNAGLYLGFAQGATIVAYGGNTLSATAWTWLALIGITVFCTVHMQDIPDQEGDSARGRNTVPLVIGDNAARWTIAAAMPVASALLPTFWELRPEAYLPTVGICAVVVTRVIAKRTVEADEVTWKIWNLWMSSVYLLPFIKSLYNKFGVTT